MRITRNQILGFIGLMALGVIVVTPVFQAHAMSIASQTAVISAAETSVDDQVSAHVGGLLTWGIALGVLALAIAFVLALLFKPFRALLAKIL